MQLVPVSQGSVNCTLNNRWLLASKMNHPATDNLPRIVGLTLQGTAGFEQQWLHEFWVAAAWVLCTELCVLIEQLARLLDLLSCLFIVAAHRLGLGRILPSSSGIQRPCGFKVLQRSGAPRGLPSKTLPPSGWFLSENLLGSPIQNCCPLLPMSSTEWPVGPAEGWFLAGTREGHVKRQRGILGDCCCAGTLHGLLESAHGRLCECNEELLIC